MKLLPLPPTDRLDALFVYVPETGELLWRVRPAARSRRRAGDAAGTLHHSGYLQVRIEGVIYLVHRIIWKLVEGSDPKLVDHKNRVRSDNRWDNLRDATHSQNNMNRNPLNYHKGVHYIARTNKYGAQVKADGEHFWLGCFDTPELACEAYRKVAQELHGEFYRSGGCGCP